MRMLNQMARLPAVVMSLGVLLSPPVIAQQNDTDLLARLELLQHQIDELEHELEQTRNQTTETEAKVDAVADAIESQPQQQFTPWQNTTIGGYGELHYSNLDADDPSHDLEEIDFHRFVLMFGHQFNDSTRFYSELELEHSLIEDSGGETPGEVELEQAYVEFDLNPGLHSKAGLFLLPVGILNETHEPNTFFGVERNQVESIIIPSTWWEAGAAMNGLFGSGWTWDLAVSSGLSIPTSGGSAFRIRSGRQKVAEATAKYPAVTGRLRYLGIAGLQAAVTVQHQFDASQVGGDGLDDATLLEAHIDYRRAGFGLRALYARWNLSGSDAKTADADLQTGWYIEPSYRINDRFGFYTRYEDVEGARGVDQFDEWQFGMNWWPNDNVVVKIDYRSRDHDVVSEGGHDFTGVDLGIGYAF